MENNSTTKLLETSGLTIIKPEKKTVKPAKLVNLKQIAEKPGIILPPPQEMYIKPKKHDFL